MLPRPKLAGLFPALVASAALLLWGCSSSSPRDLNYGTDVGLGYVPPDVAPTAPDTTVIETTASADAVDDGSSSDSANADSANTVDGMVDASIDGAD